MQEFGGLRTYLGNMEGMMEERLGVMSIQARSDEPAIPLSTEVLEEEQASGSRLARYLRIQITVQGKKVD